MAQPDLEHIEMNPVNTNEQQDCAASNEEQSNEAPLLQASDTHAIAAIKITCLNVILPIGSLLLYMFDVATDVNLALSYYYAQYDSVNDSNHTPDDTVNQTGFNDTVGGSFSSVPAHFMYFCLTLTFIILPGVFMSLMNANTYLSAKVTDDYPPVSSLQKVLRIACIVLCISPVAW